MPETRGLCLSEEQTVTTVRVFENFFLILSQTVGAFFVVCLWTRDLYCTELDNLQVLWRPRFGPGNQARNIITEPYKLTRRCDVTAILILYGLPRFVIYLTLSNVCTGR